LELGKSTVFRLLSTLKSRGFVEQNEINDKYSLSYKFIHIGTVVRKRQNLIQKCHKYLEELTYEINETSHLAILDETLNVIMLDKFKSNNSIQMDSEIGGRMPSYCTATGKTMLAYRYKKTYLHI